MWPEGCHAEGERAALRRAAACSGTLSIDGVGKRYSAALVKVFWLDGQTPRLHADRAASRRCSCTDRPTTSAAWAKSPRPTRVLGVEHILTGVDHLMFVLGLLFLVGFNRRLVWTITAFTLAHSLTLALSALGWLTLRSPPVEATIALSIVLVAAEALHKRQTLSRRWPALVAFLFGLVHGLGFAGALEGDRPAAEPPVGRAADVQRRRRDRSAPGRRRRLSHLSVPGQLADVRHCARARALCHRQRRRLLVDRPDRQHLRVAPSTAH